MPRFSLAAALAALVFLAGTSAALAQLTVLPVNIQLQPGQKAATITVINNGDSQAAFQLRAFAWNQDGGIDRLNPTDALLLSPPIGVIPPGHSQIMRLVLRQTPRDREAAYRILLDELPPPAEPGIIHVVLRLSLPVFAEPGTRASPRIRWGMEHANGQTYLTAFNNGTQHETVRDIALTVPGGGAFKPEAGESPYILAGATRRWRLPANGPRANPGTTLRLTAQSETGPIDQAIPAGPGP